MNKAPSLLRVMRCANTFSSEVIRHHLPILDYAMGIKSSLWKQPRRLTPLREVTRTPQNETMHLPALTGVPGRY